MIKPLPSVLGQLTTRKTRHNVRVLGKLLLVFAALVVLFSVLFQLIMRWEGQNIAG